MSILDRTANEKPEDSGTLVKFIRPGDAIVGQFVSRKTGIKTQMSKDDTDLANITRCLVVNSTIPDVKPGDIGAIFEGGHVRQIMDEWHLTPGEGFLLRFAETKGRFKKFFAKKLTAEELGEEAETKGVTLGGVPF
jgi:hypothetical protein